MVLTPTEDFIKIFVTETMMKILSINISRIKTVEYLGKTVTTGFFKEPCYEPITIDTLKIQGDEQADLKNHGGVSKAVYAFSDHHYNYWRNTFNQQDLTYGAFGENLTISHLDEDNVFIGDQFRCGSALLEVSQPRVPCFKFAMAFNNKKAPKLFIDNQYTGVYFRVIETGTVSGEDSLILEKRLDDSVSVKTLFRAYFDKSFEDANEVLTKAYKMPELAPEWQSQIKQKLKLDV